MQFYGSFGYPLNFVFFSYNNPQSITISHILMSNMLPDISPALCIWTNVGNSVTKVVPEEQLYTDALNEMKSKDNSEQSNKIIMFGDGITCGISISGFNYLKSGETKFKYIFGASAH